MSRRSSHPARTGRRSRPGFLARLVLCIVVLMGAPTIAQAAFTNADTSVTTVGTYDIPAPASVTGTQSCGLFRQSLSVTITDFGAVPRATGYTVTLTGPNGQTTTNTLAANTRSTTISRTSSSGVYTLRIRANVGTWTGDNLERSLTC